jgi:hypothetical protein
MSKQIVLKELNILEQRAVAKFELNYSKVYKLVSKH